MEETGDYEKPEWGWRGGSVDKTLEVQTGGWELGAPNPD